MDSGGGGDGGAEVHEESLDPKGKRWGKGRLASGDEGRKRMKEDKA